MKKSRCINRKGVCISLILLICIGVCIWKMVRSDCTISCQTGTEAATGLYTETEKVVDAISLSYLVYGCENSEDLSGTVKELVANNRMGILIENFGIRRTDEKEPATAVFSSSEFICKHVGDFRFLMDEKDEDSGFYGAAFCDDEAKCIWIVYAGTVTLSDMIACIELVVAPDLSAQEASAFTLYQAVMESEEVTKQAYRVMLTGHSLGGALASMVSRMSGCSAVTINGADGLAIDKVNDIVGETPTEYEIANYMTTPKNGTVSLMDAVQRLMFLGSYKDVTTYVFEENGLTTDTHSAFSFIRLAKQDDGMLDIETPQLPVTIE